MASKTRIEVQRRGDTHDGFERVAVFEAEGTFAMVSSDSDIRIQITPVEERGY